jgi:hypothetical protein
MLLCMLLRLVPRPLRSRWPFRRYFWQPEEIAVILERAKARAAQFGWYCD